MKVVLDTNILVSATFWTGDSFRVLALADERKIRNISSKEIIKEYYKAVFSEEIIDKTQKMNLSIIKSSYRIIGNSQIIEPSIKLDVVKEDPDDNKILECAKDGKAEFIITKDNHLLKLKQFESIKIITPEDFLKLYR